MSTTAVRKPRILNLKDAFVTGKNARGMEWSEALTLFLRSRRLGIYGAYHPVRERSIKEYVWDLNKFFAFMRERQVTYYNQMTEAHVMDYFGWLQDSQRGKQHEGWSQASQNKYLKSLKAFFHWVELDPTCRDEHMRSFMTSMPRIPKSQGRLWIPSPDEMQGFHNSFNQKVRWGFRDYVIMALMLDCGPRVGEICYLKPSHLKLDSSPPMILIPEEGKTGSRLVPIDAEIMVPLLKRWLREREWFAKSEYLFVNRFGGSIKPNTIRQAFDEVRERTGIGVSEQGNLSAHTVRHFFCTHYLVNGGSLHNLQKITGHKSLETLMIYVHLANQMTQVSEEHSRVSPLKNLGKTLGVKKRRKVV